MESLSSLNPFKKPVDPVKEAKKWQRNIGREMRQLDRQIKAMEKAEANIVKELKATAKKEGMQQAVTILAKDVVRARQTRDKLFQGFRSAAASTLPGFGMLLVISLPRK